MANMHQNPLKIRLPALAPGCEGATCPRLSPPPCSHLHAAGHISVATAEEKTALDELAEKDLIRDGHLSEAGWMERADYDRSAGFRRLPSRACSGYCRWA